MTGDRWQRVKQLFDAIVELEPAERTSFLHERCAGDPEMLGELQSLLAHDEDDAPPAGEHTGRQIGNYLIGRQLAQGGMGVVYRGRHLTLPREVVVKCIRPIATSGSAAAELIARFKREAHIQSQLDHPHIVRVYEFFSAGDEYFLVMEYVSGTSLRARLDCAGPLPPEQTIDLAMQALDGLDHAHRLPYVDEGGHPRVGIIHRDIKPANLLVDERGTLKLTDFGIAKAAAVEALTMTGFSPGTVEYMSPEQVRNGQLDARSDLYSLGITLYEFLTGRPPFPRSSGGSDYEVLRAHVEREAEPLHGFDSGLSAAVMRSLKKDPSDRWQSAAEFRAALANCGLGGHTVIRPVVPLPPSRRNRWGGGRPLAWAAAALAMATGVGIYAYWNRGPILTETDTIVLADFMNKTGDGVFDDALRQAVSLKLAESPRMNLLPDEKIERTLRLMGRKAGETVTPQLGREICERNGLKAIVSGSIAQVGTTYALYLEATNCATGETVAQSGAEANGKNSVLPAVGRAAVALRRKLGESLGSIEKFDTPFEATSTSLEALKSFTLARKARREGKLSEQLALLERSVALDPKFAYGYAGLSTEYSNLRQSDKAAENGRKGFELRDQVTEKERFYLLDKFYGNVLGDLEQQIKSDRLWTIVYPRDYLAFANLGSAYGKAGQIEHGLDATLEAIRLNPDSVAPYVNAMGYYAALGRYEEAKRIYAEARKRNLSYRHIPVYYYGIAFLQHDEEGMAQALAQARSKQGGDDEIVIEQALVEAYLGRLKQAQGLLRQAIETAKGKQDAASVRRLYGIRAHVESMMGAKLDARADAALAAFSAVERDALSLAGWAFSRIGDLPSGKAVELELLRLFPSNTIAGLNLAALQATIESNAGRPDRAIELLKPVVRYDFASAGGTMALYPAFVRGEAYLRARDGRGAAAEFQKILDHPGIVINSPVGSLARLGMARSLALTGDVVRSRRAFQEFFTLWKEADADLPVLVDARREFRELTP